MLKTIKTTKQLRLDELIKYCRENEIKNKTFYSSSCVWLGLSNGEQVKTRKQIMVDKEGCFSTHNAINTDDLFTVEVEEEITEDTKIDRLVEVYTRCSQLYVINHTRKSINEILSEEEKHGVKTLTIYALINGKLELIWERDNQ